MAGSMNRATIVGRVGKEPESRTFQNGGMVCNLSVATSESWKDKATGEKKERTEWHRINIFNEHIAKVAQSYVKKGDLVLIEGQIETRKYEKDGRDVYTTEIVLRPYNGLLQILSSSGKKEDGGGSQGSSSSSSQGQSQGSNAMDDEIPF